MCIQSNHYVKRKGAEHKRMLSFVKNAIFWKTSCDRILSKALFDDQRKKKNQNVIAKKKIASIFDHILAPQGNEIVCYILKEISFERKIEFFFPF